ncbi:MAG: ABC transporter permease [Proteobacteria bacterium]|nr:ABC transporter permease [Pseudomonadota bacterium]
MKARWELFLIPSFVVSLVLMVGSQFFFLRRSFYRDLGFGRIGKQFELTNYINVLSDSFYLDVLWVTVQVSFLAALFTLVMGAPLAYLIARMRSNWAMVLLAGIVVSTFVTIVIKVFGLIIIFSADGLVNKLLLGSGLLSDPFTILGSKSGIVVGLLHFTLGFGVLLLYGIFQTIPRSLEEAAQILGASRARVHWRVVVPLALPAITIGSIMIFNMCMGAFTSAALLGGARVLTLPVLIERTVILQVKYSTGATLAAILLVSVVLINLFSVYLLTRLRATQRVIT